MPATTTTLASRATGPAGLVRLPAVPQVAAQRACCRCIASTSTSSGPPFLKSTICSENVEALEGAKAAQMALSSIGTIWGRARSRAGGPVAPSGWER
jgi:hypothetical protein